MVKMVRRGLRQIFRQAILVSMDKRLPPALLEAAQCKQIIRQAGFEFQGLIGQLRISVLLIDIAHLPYFGE
jgi:hypothetical protein